MLCGKTDGKILSVLTESREEGNDQSFTARVGGITAVTINQCRRGTR